jgi:hypothetical protein
MKKQFLTVALVVVWSAPAAADDETKPIPPAKAVNRVGQPVRVEMQVRKAKDALAKHGLIYLDSEDDFHKPTNLGVAITTVGAAKFRAKGIVDPAAHFLGKTICVRGEILIFETRPYLPVTDPGQLEIVETKK